MKKLKITSFIILVTLFFASCTPKPAEMVVGEWKITDIQSTQEISEDLAEIHQQTLEEMKASSKMVINADGTFENTISETSSKGKWTLSEDAKTFTRVYDNGDEEVSKVIELSENKFVTSIDINEETNTIVYEKQVGN